MNNIGNRKGFWWAGFCCLMLRVGGSQAAESTTGAISLPEGFRAELVYSVPFDEQGSWVSLAVDDQGRLISSDQYGGLYRITPSRLGEEAAKTAVERIDVEVGGAHGLLVHGGALYAVVSTSEEGFEQGLFRITDTDGDDDYDHFEKLIAFDGGGEHGPHAIIASPDGKSFYLCAGNHTKLPEFETSRVPQHWDEDQLLPNILDPGGHAVGIKAPGGWICEIDLDGKNLELVSVGYRNEFDIVFNDQGELFTFDADMEWDIGTPWFRPTRVCHAVSGSDFGWRTGNAKWPTYFPDTLPPVADIGPGSPTGIAFAWETNFPEEYRQALFLGDWSYGNIYAIYLEADGSTYTGRVEPFASAMPLAVTDIVVRPQDGAMYFTVGGRRTGSALYRIVYDGKERPVAAEQSSLSETERGNARELREQRHALERLHSTSAPAAIDRIWPSLAHDDRFIRHAARVALEFQPVDSWRARALAEAAPTARLSALLALVRSDAPGSSSEVVAALTSLDWDGLSLDLQLELLRIAELVLIRGKDMGDDDRQRLVQFLDPKFPAGEHRIDRELSQLLVQLEAREVVPRILQELANAVTSEQQIDFALALSVAKGDWTLERRKQFFEWFQKIAASHGGNSYFEYLVRARERFIETFSEQEREALAELIEAKYQETGEVKAVESRPFVKKWTLEELQEIAVEGAGQREFQKGRKLFAAAQCSQCHRVAGEGSSVGPDLTGSGGRLSEADLLRAIVEPSHQISDQYQQTVFEINGRVVVGRILNLHGDNLFVSSNMADPKNLTRIKRNDIEDRYPSKVSIMPEGLLNTLTAEEVLDLMAFLRSGGNREHPLYRGASSSR